MSHQLAKSYQHRHEWAADWGTETTEEKERQRPQHQTGFASLPSALANYCPTPRILHSESLFRAELRPVILVPGFRHSRIPRLQRGVSHGAEVPDTHPAQAADPTLKAVSTQTLWEPPARDSQPHSKASVRTVPLKSHLMDASCWTDESKWLLQIKIWVFYRDKPKMIWFKKLLKHDKGIEQIFSSLSSKSFVWHPSAHCTWF